MYRQGDILFIPRFDLNEVGLVGTKQQRRDDGALIVAEGELTGHAHAIKELQADIFTGGWGGGNAATRYLRALAGVEVTHEEHKTVSLPKGTYEIRQQREYSHGPVAHRD